MCHSKKLDQLLCIVYFFLLDNEALVGQLARPGTRDYQVYEWAKISGCAGEIL
jgi:hypothetical protein